MPLWARKRTRSQCQVLFFRRDNPYPCATSEIPPVSPIWQFGFVFDLETCSAERSTDPAGCSYADVVVSCSVLPYLVISHVSQHAVSHVSMWPVCAEPQSLCSSASHRCASATCTGHLSGATTWPKMSSLLEHIRRHPTNPRQAPQILFLTPTSVLTPLQALEVFASW